MADDGAVVDGFVDAVVNAQCDLVFAGAQSTFKQQPVFAFRRQSAVQVARPGDYKEFRTGGWFDLCADPVAFRGEGGTGGIVVA